jgi:hypothetical protein
VIDNPPRRYIATARSRVGTDGRRMKYTRPRTAPKWMTPRPATVPQETPAGGVVDAAGASAARVEVEVVPMGAVIAAATGAKRRAARDGEREPP